MEDASPSASGHLDAETLFRRHAPFVARFLMRLGIGSAEVDDLVQEVFLVAHTRGGYVPAGAKATTWLAQIAVHIASNARRKRARRAANHEDASVSGLASPGDPQSRLAAAQALTRVREALDALDIDHRAVFVLFEIEREPCDAIAAGMGIPVGTVYSRIHKARAVFREEYQRVAGTPAYPPIAAAR